MKGEKQAGRKAAVVVLFCIFPVIGSAVLLGVRLIKWLKQNRLLNNVAPVLQ